MVALLFLPFGCKRLTIQKPTSNVILIHSTKHITKEVTNIMKIRAANGSYSPSNFYMHIESNEQIEECVRNNEQTFVHEYIHFLQDLILPYSIRNTLTSKRRFLSVLLHANKVKKNYTTIF